MEYFSKLNQKLDQGFKLTDVSCQNCKKTALFNPADSTFQCVNCEKILDFEVDSSSLAPPASSSSPLPQKSSSSPPPLSLNPPPSSSSISKSNELSSKLAQKLLRGYTMLEECCPDCLVPLMRLKKEAAVCVGCDYKWLASSSSHHPPPPPPLSSPPPPSSSFPPVSSSNNNQKTEKNLDKPRALSPPPPSVSLISPPQPTSAFPPSSSSLNLIRDNLLEMTSMLSSLYLEETKDIVKGKNLRGADNLINGALPQLISLFNQLNNNQK